MKICRLKIKNFGKFSDREIRVSDGIQLFYGENESGKSTIHTFIKGMFFGMERGRGRASVNDTFSLYEPWENPACYAGSLEFESGGKRFFVHRNFDKYTRKAELICAEDGEELSIENGDLEMLLEGMDAAGYENTVSVGQLRSEPGQPLAAALKNFATSYYAAGTGDLDLQAALEDLDGKRREIDREIKAELQKRQEKRDRTGQEASYVWRDIHRLREEQAKLEEEVEFRRAQQEEQKRQEEEELGIRKGLDEIRPPKWRIHPVEILIFLALVAASFIVFPRPWNYLVSIVVALCCGIYVWNRMKVGKKQEKTEPEKLLEEITPEEEKEPFEKLLWKLEELTGALKEKQIQYENLQERLEEMEELGTGLQKLEEQKAAVALATQKLNELSAKLQEKLKASLDERVSEIVSRITGGKYSHLVVEDHLRMSLLTPEGRKIGAERLSRGTVEQIYFALRMAAGELLYEEDYPVVLDDTFAYYDDERLEHTLGWLHENKKQVLIFTCQKREEELLNKLQIPYKKEVV